MQPNILLNGAITAVPGGEVTIVNPEIDFHEPANLAAITQARAISRRGAFVGLTSARGVIASADLSWQAASTQHPHTHLDITVTPVPAAGSSLMTFEILHPYAASALQALMALREAGPRGILTESARDLIGMPVEVILSENYIVALRSLENDPAVFISNRPAASGLTPDNRQLMEPNTEPELRAAVTLFDSQGNGYARETWLIPVGAMTAQDMPHSPDFRQIDGGPVLIQAQPLADAGQGGTVNFGASGLLL